MKVKIYFTLPRLNATKVVMFNCHVSYSAKGRYVMILDRDLLTALGLNLKWSEHVIDTYDGTLKMSSSTMVDLGTYELGYFSTGESTPEEPFINSYI